MEFNLFNTSNFDGFDEAVYGNNPLRKIEDIKNSENNIDFKILCESEIQNNEISVFDQQIMVQNMETRAMSEKMAEDQLAADQLAADQLLVDQLAAEKKISSKVIEIESFMESCISNHLLLKENEFEDLLSKSESKIINFSRKEESIPSKAHNLLNSIKLSKQTQKESVHLLEKINHKNADKLKDPLLDLKDIYKKSSQDVFDMSISTFLDYVFPISSFSDSELRFYGFNVSIVSVIVKSMSLDKYMTETKFLNLIRVVSLLVYDTISDQLKKK
jgi:hypothetical protein